MIALIKMLILKGAAFFAAFLELFAAFFMDDAALLVQTKGNPDYIYVYVVV
jgi:hypothetical protein